MRATSAPTRSTHPAPPPFPPAQPPHPVKRGGRVSGSTNCGEADEDAFMAYCDRHGYPQDSGEWEAAARFISAALNLVVPRGAKTIKAMCEKEVRAMMTAGGPLTRFHEFLHEQELPDLEDGGPENKIYVWVNGGVYERPLPDHPTQNTTTTLAKRRRIDAPEPTAPVVNPPTGTIEANNRPVLTSTNCSRERRERRLQKEREDTQDAFFVALFTLNLSRR
jgi:hypothetical protein